jgi:tyrosyl-tRNA synthetase
VSPDEQLRELRRGVVDLHVEAELRDRLREGRPLKVKAGFDPTRPDLHLGHTVLMNKMRQFQDLGHEVVFIVGEFTAQIGDPSGRNQTRRVPSREEIEQGARTYAEQAFMILDRDRTRIVYNSEWLGKMGFDDVLRLAGKYTLARMMERDDFKKRWEQHASISVHELLYPLAQGYDSVVLECDVELGGTDQLFNLLVGRELMKEHGQRPQIVMTTPILEGINARVEGDRIVGDKMSKSLDNYVGVTEAPTEQLGKLMSVSDGLMWRYYELLSGLGVDAIRARREACAKGDLHPKEAKMALAKEVVTRFHGDAAARDAAERWEAQFSRREVPADLPERSVRGEGGALWLPKVLAEAGLVPSTTEGRRRVQQGAVEVDGQRITDVQARLVSGQRYVIKAGKRAWAAVTVE